MTSTDVVQRSIDTWNSADRQGYLACYVDDCEFVTPAMAGTGHEAVAGFWAANMGGFPENRVLVTVLAGEGDLVIEEAVFEGTNTAPTSGPDRSEIPATGKPLVLPFAAVHTVRDGRIVRSRFYWDGLSIAGQLGLTPA